MIHPKKHIRAVAISAALALVVAAAGGCSLFRHNYRCQPAPGPDEPDAETPDTVLAATAADTTSHLPCEWQR